jgi:hypothetical protein
VSGFFEYHAVPTNSRALKTFRHHVTNLWRRSLQRRSQKNRITWNRKLADAFIPQAHILHPWSDARFAVKTPKVGAECLNRACSDLCGGRLAMSVPTAID